jgi:hypothetical protein
LIEPVANVEAVLARSGKPGENATWKPISLPAKLSCLFEQKQLGEEHATPAKK